MKQSDYVRFKKTFEAAHGQQRQSPFSKFLSGQIEYSAIDQCLEQWNRCTAKPNPLLYKLHHWLETEVDPERIENELQIPAAYLEGLRNLDCLRAKIPEEYGGLGMTQCRFSQLLEKLGSWSEVLALVVSVQQLGVAQGLTSLQKLEKPDKKHKGEALRSKYLSQLAQNAIGAFSLTTPETGSDPSRLQTVARAAEDGSYYELSGDWSQGGKLFTTLGTIADLYIMLAVVVYSGEDIQILDPRKRITAFIVERDFPGISVKPLSFCGWHGLPNAAVKLDKVKVPAENIVGDVGDGLKIAFMNLGSGRINISAISLGMMKQLARIARWWAVERVQGGKPIGEHQLNTEQLVKMNASVYACESFLQFVSALADQPDADIRLEAAMLKLFTSHTLMDIADETLQLRGGRGYESYASQANRGDTAVAVERLYRSARMMKIGEGGSNILQLYVMRCLLNDFLKVYKEMSSKELPLKKKSNLFIQTCGQLVKGNIIPINRPKTALPRPLKAHMRYVAKESRRMNRMLLFKIAAEYRNFYYKKIKRFVSQSDQPIPPPGESFEQRQVLLGHCAQIAMLLSAITVTCQRAASEGNPEAIELADAFCTDALEKVSLHCIKIKNHHGKQEKTITRRGAEIMTGRYAGIVEQNIMRKDLPNIKN